MRTVRTLLFVSTAMAGWQAAPALAQSSALEARLNRLEQDVTQLRAELESEKSKNAALQQQISAVQAGPVARTDAPPPNYPSQSAITPAVAVAAAPDGFRVGGTTLKIGGFIKTVAMSNRFSDGPVAGNSLGRDFYVPSAIPVVAGKGDAHRYTDFSAKQTRLALTTNSTVGTHKLGGYIEGDFQSAPGTQGSERTSNAYNFALRRAYLTFDNLLAGQDWTTFMNPAALPETADFLGVTEGAVFVRQPQVRYTMALSPNSSLAIAVENPETSSTSARIAGLAENDTDKLPDVAARLSYRGGWGELGFAGLLRQLSLNANNGVSDSRMGWGLSGSGRLLFGDARQHNFSFMATYGSGIGRYVGLNFAPDTIAYFPATGGVNLRPVDIFAAYGAARFALSPSVRTTIMGSYQDPRYERAYRLPGSNERAWSAGANLFWSPAKGFDVGAEYRHAVRTIWAANGVTPAEIEGALDQLLMAFKYSF